MKIEEEKQTEIESGVGKATLFLKRLWKYWKSGNNRNRRKKREEKSESALLWILVLSGAQAVVLGVVLIALYGRLGENRQERFVTWENGIGILVLVMLITLIRIIIIKCLPMKEREERKDSIVQCWVEWFMFSKINTFLPTLAGVIVFCGNQFQKEVVRFPILFWIMWFFLWMSVPSNWRRKLILFNQELEKMDEETGEEADEETNKKADGKKKSVTMTCSECDKQIEMQANAVIKKCTCICPSCGKEQFFSTDYF